MTTTKTVHQYIDELVVREGNGKYTDAPKDSGGPTRWGITEATARAYGYTGPMRELPREVAVYIYLARYWTGPRFDRIHQVDTALAERLLDFGVLAGQATAAKHLQRCLNVLNRGGSEYTDIKADGLIGAMTIAALESFVARRGATGRTVLLGMVTALQSEYLIDLAERRPKDEEWQFGWQLNRAIGAVMTTPGGCHVA